MKLLDSNVVSALMRLKSEPAVEAWLDNSPENDLCTSAMTVHEMLRGIGRLQAGLRRSELERQFEFIMRTFLFGRILSFDTAAAEAAAKIEVARSRKGRSVDLADTQIAGIAVAVDAAIVTRNIRHFAGLDVEVIDPWATR